MRKIILTIAILAVYATISGGILACEPGGMNSIGGKGFNSFGALPANGYNAGGGQQFANSFGAMAAMQQRQMDQARANFAAQAAAYREQMRPIRQAAAVQKREQMLAKREANRAKIMAEETARRNALQTQEQQQAAPPTSQFANQSPFRETQTVVRETPPVQQQPFSYTSFFK